MPFANEWDVGKIVLTFIHQQYEWQGFRKCALFPVLPLNYGASLGSSCPLCALLHVSLVSFLCSSALCTEISFFLVIYAVHKGVITTKLAHRGCTWISAHRPGEQNKTFSHNNAGGSEKLLNKPHEIWANPGHSLTTPALGELWSPLHSDLCSSVIWSELRGPGRIYCCSAGSRNSVCTGSLTVGLVCF